MSIRENYESIIETMERACARSGRNPEEVTLCGVSKYVDTDRMQEAYDAGVRLFGENHNSWVPTYKNEYGIMSWLLNQVKGA